MLTVAQITESIVRVAKLSRKFYETFGDDIANEFAEWFNLVDMTYRADLRQLNEVNFQRFDAKLEQRFAEFDAKWERRVAELQAKWEGQTAQLRTEMAKQKTDLVKWMFVFWMGNVTATAGIIFAVANLAL